MAKLLGDMQDAKALLAEGKLLMQLVALNHKLSRMQMYNLLQMLNHKLSTMQMSGLLQV